MAEKLTNGVNVGVRFSVPGNTQLERLAKFRKMDKSDYIRHLVARDAAEVAALMNEVIEVFSGSPADASLEAFNDVLQDSLTASQFGYLGDN